MKVTRSNLHARFQAVSTLIAAVGTNGSDRAVPQPRTLSGLIVRVEVWRAAMSLGLPTPQKMTCCENLLAKNILDDRQGNYTRLQAVVRKLRTAAW